MVAADMMWKLHPLIEKLRNNFLKHFVPLSKLNFDESMVAYYGCHSCKQFIRGKPICLGYKMWCLNRGKALIVMMNMKRKLGKQPL
jgi:hypothetical protein